MKHFYKNLNKGQTKDHALQQAKTDYLETAHPSRTYPYYWAGFVLLGDNAVVFSERSSSWLLFFLLLTALLLIFTVMVKRKIKAQSH